MFPQVLIGFNSFSDFPCFWWPWRFWGVLPGSLQNVSQFGFLWCLSYCLTAMMCFEEEDHSGEVPFSWSHQEYTLSTPDVVLLMSTLIPRLTVFVRFFHSKFPLILLPFCTGIRWNEVMKLSWHLRRAVLLLLLQGEVCLWVIWNSSVQICLLSHLSHFNFWKVSSVE